jgi:hypothetical protein
LIPPAFERPNCGRSKAGGIKSFFGSFFSKKELLPSFRPPFCATLRHALSTARL